MTTRIKILTRAAAAGVAGVLLLGGVGFGLRAASEGQGPEVGSPPPRLPVAVATVERRASYEVVERFLGRIEPARRAPLAFEMPGLVTEVLVEEGQAVRAGAVVARLDDAALRARRDQLAAQRDQVAADLDLARRTLERQRTLRDQGHAPTQRYDEARLAAKALEARLKETEAGLRAIDIDLAKTALRAPFAGTVGRRLVDEGVVVEAGAAVVDLLETARPQARIGVPPDLAATLRAGQETELDLSGRTVRGTVAAVRPDLSGPTRTVPVLIDLDGSVTAGFGDVVALRTTRNVAVAGTWVPLSALVEGGRGLWDVFLLRSAGDGDAEATKVVRESVEVLHVAGDAAYVAGGLADGDRIVAAGPHRIVPGQAVTVAQAD